MFSPAYYQPGNPPHLTLFPAGGNAVAIALPASMRGDMRVIRFDPGGRAMYAQSLDVFNRANTIEKIQFQPARESAVPGSAGFGEVSCLAFPQSSTKMIVSGWPWSYNGRGAFELDPDTAAILPLPAGSPSLCGGAGGLLSPDGSRVVATLGKGLGVFPLGGGAAQKLRGTTAGTHCSWSPNAEYLACAVDGRIAMFKMKDLSKPRGLGRAGDAPFEWSPDSHYLLLRTSPLSCMLTFYGESLAILDVETGKRAEVRSSHCTITGGNFGWLESGVR